MATIKFEGGFSPYIDSWDAMMDQLDIEKRFKNNNVKNDGWWQSSKEQFRK